MATTKRRILYVSPPYCGSIHDYAMMKLAFDPQAGLWFEEKGIYVDLGFLGIEKEYRAKHIFIPDKRAKRKSKESPRIEFTEEQKNHNKSVSKVRIKVEHAIGGLKRYRFLSDRLKCRDMGLYSKVVGIAAGLWNFQLTA